MTLTPHLVGERKLRSESALEEMKTVEALKDLNAEINMVLRAKLSEWNVNIDRLNYGDLEMFKSEDGRNMDIFYQRRCVLQMRTEVTTDGGVKFNLFYEPTKNTNWLIN
jgi:hypothetical protein